MDKTQRKHIKKLMKRNIKCSQMEITDEQMQYILEAYQESGYVIGMHKAGVTHEAIFAEGIRNQDSNYKNSTDITNTVTTAITPDIICLNTNLREDRKSAIILKIPKECLYGEENFYKVNEKGINIIPTEFILGALEDGKIYENEQYKGECKSATIRDEGEMAESIRKHYNKSFGEIQEQFQIFLQAKQEVEHPIKTAIQKLMSIFKKENKTLALPEPVKTSTRKVICEKVEEPELGDRTKYLEQNNDINIEKEGR